jgi:probable H4MPT-linked C1 transfer pathway protein
MNADKQPTAWLVSSESPQWIGLDIGGANIKIADGQGRSMSLAYALWKEPQGLAAAIASLIADFGAPRDTPVALTMTGELADCYATKADGVRAIVGATLNAAQGRIVRVAAVDDRWLTPVEAKEETHLVAAANWRLGARLVGRSHPNGRGVWVDIGSTTTDVIPIEEGTVIAAGANDTQRLLAGELVYTGVRRTPVCALADRLPYRGQECPVAAEWFATTADIWLLLGQVPEDPNNCGTADDRPMVRPSAIERLARCVCADRTSFDESDALTAARHIAAIQIAKVADAIARHGAEWAVFTGEGEFMAKQVGNVSNVFIASDFVGASARRAFPAHAAAVLASHEIGAAR